MLLVVAAEAGEIESLDRPWFTASTVENIFVRLLIFIIVFIQFEYILLVHIQFSSAESF